MNVTPSAAPSSKPTGLRFAIVAAQYHAALADALLAHCVAALAGAKTVRVVRVPGSFEVTVAAGRLARSGRYDCVIALGVLLQGETKHADHIGQAVASGLTQIGIETGVPVILGIVTAQNLAQARARCLGKTYNRGREAATTAVAMARLCKHL